MIIFMCMSTLKWNNCYWKILKQRVKHYWMNFSNVLVVGQFFPFRSTFIFKVVTFLKISPEGNTMLVGILKNLARFIVSSYCKLKFK